MAEQLATDPVDASSNGAPPVEDGWKTDGRGRLYVPRPAGAGVVFRREEETIAQALARDAAPGKDKRPRRKSKAAKRPPMPEAPEGVDLKQLEAMLSEALQAPAMAAAMMGDTWAADHFTQQGPFLARNLVIAAEHNPWLRRKLEGLVTGQDAAAKMIAMLGVTGALVGYAVPPIVWWLNLPVPDQARTMFRIPPARERNPSPTDPDAPGPETASPAADPIAA